MYCARWEFFGQFLKDMGIRPEGTTLDRLDNALGYYKDNCKWSTAIEQRNNRAKLGVKKGEGAMVSVRAADALARLISE